MSYWIGNKKDIERLNYDITGFLILTTENESFNVKWAVIVENTDKTQAAVPVCEKYKQENKINANINESTDLPNDFNTNFFIA